ncbi:MAG: hypothetical protein HYS87_03330 [Candidatus Colwellbacteria bacterium]|nr:hypothetical protein [Candidatus Colwellbacteria bacterium]
MDLIISYASLIWQFLLENWAVLLVLGLTFLFIRWVFKIAIKNYLIRKQDATIKKIKWVVLQVIFPKDNEKSPKAMEQVFAGFHAWYSYGYNWYQVWVEGEVERWMSLEIVGHAGKMGFYIRVPAGFKKTVMDSFFAQYPNVEITEVPDYFDSLPENLPNETFSTFSTDFMLARDNAYPLKTYDFFEEAAEEKRLDPISTFGEVMSNLKEDEMLILQLIIRPHFDEYGKEWKDKGKEIVDKLYGRPSKKPEKNPIIAFLDFIVDLISTVAGGKGGAETAKKEEKLMFKFATPGEQEAAERIDRKMSKVAFECALRFTYIDSRNAFTGSNITAGFAGIAQYATRDLNSFKPNMKTFIKKNKVGSDSKNVFVKFILGDYFFRKERLERRRRLMFRAAKERYIPQYLYTLSPMFNQKSNPKVTGKYRRLGSLLGRNVPFGALQVETFILGIDELATLFHPPVIGVGATKIEYQEARKGKAPVDLPILEE